MFSSKANVECWKIEQECIRRGWLGQMDDDGGMMKFINTSLKQQRVTLNFQGWCGFASEKVSVIYFAKYPVFQNSIFWRSVSIRQIYQFLNHFFIFSCLLFFCFFFRLNVICRQDMCQNLIHWREVIFFNVSAKKWNFSALKWMRKVLFNTVILDDEK